MSYPACVIAPLLLVVLGLACNDTAPARSVSQGPGFAIETHSHRPSAEPVLVVDDNAMNLMVARLQLKQCWPQSHVVVASSAAEALKLLEAEAFDVALIDMIMPEMDGMQLTQQIRLQFSNTTSHMPILALTANTNPVERQRCLDAGMDDVLHKPMDLEQLVRVIPQHIARVRSLQRA